MSRDDQHELAEIARQTMIDRGLLPEFPKEVDAEVGQLTRREPPADGLEDQRELLWASIDNDDSRDLDQLSVARRIDGDSIQVLIAIADVDAYVKKGSAIDRYAMHNTTTVYTPARNFSMLPEELSTDRTSLNENEDRLAVVTELTIRDDGELEGARCYRALVRNQAKLAYDSVGTWLEGQSDPPEKVKQRPDLQELLRLQDTAAQDLRELRFEQGALDLETIEARAIMADGKVIDMKDVAKNRARELIEDFMIAANGATARYLQSKEFATIRRVVRTPERWDRIVSLALEHGEKLPSNPDSAALEQFLRRRRKADPLRFPDLSLSIVKLMGKGEYAVEYAGQSTTGHFGLAVRDYTHSTAPNRRYPDLITQRMLKAAIANGKNPYSDEELEHLAQHCTKQEDAANKVERQVRKSAAALLLSDRIDQRFDGIVTGASEKGTWVRIFRPTVEGRLVQGWKGLDVGDKVRVKLIGTNVERGFIDFVRAGK